MDHDKRQWRFFTRLHIGDGVASDLWGWEKVNDERQVVNSADGFGTLPSAVEDARRHGFVGDVPSAMGLSLLRRSDDATAYEFLARNLEARAYSL
jgi:hypothetical protein